MTITQTPTETLDLEPLVQALRQRRLAWREAQGRSREPAGRELPAPDTLAHVLEDLAGVLFPMRLGPPELSPQDEDTYVRRTLAQTLRFLQGLARLELQHEARVHGASRPDQGDPEQRARQRVQAFAATLPEIRAELDADIAAAFLHQPDARNMDEILLCHPGMRAMIHHRIAHQLHRQGLTLLARMAADLALSRTGIAIDPGRFIAQGYCPRPRASQLPDDEA